MQAQHYYYATKSVYSYLLVGEGGGDEQYRHGTALSLLQLRS